MKVGLSTYSMVKALRSEELTLAETITWAAEQGAEHVEIVPIGFTMSEKTLSELDEGVATTELRLSNYAISGNFLTDSREAFEEEVLRLQGEVDVAARLGIARMRHDVAWKPAAESSIAIFENALTQLVEGCQRVADYAALKGIVTSVENHGFLVQHSDRVLRLVQAVDRANFQITLDVGNFWCVDEDPYAAVQKCLPYVSMIHIKDFYARRSQQSPGTGWFASAGGRYLRGAMIGHGDLPLQDIFRA